MPRLLFDARPLAEHGGVSRVAARILAYLHQTRPDTEIVTITTGWTPQKDARVGDHRYASIHLPLPNKLWSLLTFFGLTSLDRAAEAKTTQPFHELVLPNIGFVGIPKISYTLVVHDLSFLIEPHWFPFKMRLWHHAVRAKTLIQNAARVWCVSQTTANDVVRLLHVPHERITILPQDVVTGSQFRNPHAPATEHAAPALPYVIAFTGAKRKNAATAIAAVARLKQDSRFSSLRLFLIGEQTARHHLSPPWLIPIPFLTDEQLRNYYQHASALLYPSWYEGFGLPLHEAAAFNIPLLASAHGALPETAPRGTLLIPPAKPHLWASALRDILLHHT